MPSQLKVSPLKQLFQVCTRADLRLSGHTDRMIRRAIDAGHLRKLGRTWFGTASTPAAVAGALRRQHRLTCVSALAYHGVFVPEVPGIHEVGRQCTCAGGEHLIPHPTLRAWPDAEPILAPRPALAHAVACLDPEGAAIVLESALNLGLVTGDDLPAILDPLPLRTRRAIGTPDGRAMSGPETRVRRFLERRGVKVIPQFPMPDGGFVDMLVGERLIIECDSRAHHTDPATFTSDRHRDQRYTLLGYTVLRLTYQDVMVNWATTCQLLIALLRRGVHRASRSQRRSR